MGAFAVNAELRGAWRQRCAVVKHSLPCVSGSSLALQSFRHVSCPGARDGSGRSCGDAAHVQDLKRHSEHPADAMADAVGYKSFHTFFFFLVLPFITSFSPFSPTDHLGQTVDEMSCHFGSADGDTCMFISLHANHGDLSVIAQ